MMMLSFAILAKGGDNERKPWRPFAMRRLTITACVALAGINLTFVAPIAAQSETAATAAAFDLAPLPYSVDALEPVIDAQTVAIHHGKHHQAYVDNLNRAINSDASLADVSIEQLLARVDTLPNSIRNNAGGHWNHTMFWQIMASPSSGGQPSQALERAIDAQFGSLEEFKAAFKAAGLAQFGSGWAWLIVKEDGTLAIATTANQDNPLMAGAKVPGTPILGNDVWEHAYYLRYQSRRGDYLDAWWQLVNWVEVSRRFALAMEQV